MANMKGNTNRCACGNFAAKDGFCRNCREEEHDDNRQFGTHRKNFKPGFATDRGFSDKFPIERDHY